MNRCVLLVAIAALLMPRVAFAQTDPDPYAELNKRVQQELRNRGLYAGPINGIVGPNTQAAIAQFQLSQAMPVNGMLDEATLAALGIAPPVPASAGASADRVTSEGPSASPQDRR